MGQILSWKPDGADETFVETAWERQMQIAGTTSYEKSRLREDGTLRDASETTTGQSTMRQLMAVAEKAIENTQKVLVSERTGAPLDRRGTVVLVPSDTLAMLTVRTLIDLTMQAPEPDTGVTYSRVSRMVSKGVEVELNFRNWLAVEKANVKTWFASEEGQKWAKENGVDKPPRSKADKLLDDYGGGERSIKKWAKVFDSLSEYKWDQLASYYCGDALVSSVVLALPEAFEITNPFRKGHPVKCIRMVPEFHKAFSDKEAQNAMRQTRLKPMITKPIRWKLAPS